MDIVCFDTHIIIWGVRGKATFGQEDKIEKAKYLISKCDKDGIKIMVPSVVVAEVLCALEPRLHSAVSELMHRQFIVPPFDTQAQLIDMIPKSAQSTINIKAIMCAAGNTKKTKAKNNKPRTEVLWVCNRS